MSLNPDLQSGTGQKDKVQQQSQSQQQMQQKQLYLREQILDKNLNAEDFIEYLNEKLNIESDISRCSFDQLKKVVRSYLLKIRKGEIHMSEFDQKIPSDLSSSIFSSVSSLPPVVMVKIKSEPLILEEQFNQKVKCCKIEEKHNLSQILSKKIQCIVYSPQRKVVTSYLGINTSSFLEFKVKTYGFGWQVGRRYSDFIWLRNTLKRFYPSQIIPPIPNKKAHKRSSRQLDKRMKVLSLFLNDLLSYPQFINSKYIEGFLSYQQDKFSSFKKEIDNKKQFQSIVTTQTIDGEVQIALNKQIVLYNKQLTKWVDQGQNMLKDLTRSSKCLRKGIIDQVNTLYDMGDTLGELHSGTEKISKLDTRKNNGFFKLKEIFVALNNMVVEWGSVLKNQIDLIQTNCNVVYKYLRESLSGFKQLISQNQLHEQKYLQTKIQLDALKQKLFALHDIQKWQIPKKEVAYIPKEALYEKKQAFKIMLPKQSAVLQKLKTTYCYYLSRIYENSNFCLGLKASLLCTSMQQFTIKQKVLNQQVGQTWNEMSYNFSHAFEEKTSKIKKLCVMTEQKIRKDQTDEQNNQEYSESSIVTMRKSVKN